MKVMKFGGTSMGTAESVTRIGDIVESSLEYNPIVVVSAAATGNHRATDILRKAANYRLNGQEYEDELSRFEDMYTSITKGLNLDSSLTKEEIENLRMLLKEGPRGKQEYFQPEVEGFGELLSTIVLSEHLKSRGIDSSNQNARDIGMVTDENPTDARPKEITYSLLANHLNGVEGVPVVTGYVGRSTEGMPTVLGQGSSDYTATIIGKAMGAEEILIYSDTNGIMTADPKTVTAARTIEKLHYDEAMELGFLGTKIIHPIAVKPASSAGIPIRILNTFDETQTGTTISREGNGALVTAVSFRDDVSIITYTDEDMAEQGGYAPNFFKLLDDQRTVVDLIATSEISISTTVEGELSQEKEDALREQLGDLHVKPGKAAIYVVGHNIKGRTAATSTRMYRTLEELEVEPEMSSTGERRTNLAFVVKEDDLERTVRALHKEFFETP